MNEKKFVTLISLIIMISVLGGAYLLSNPMFLEKKDSTVSLLVNQNAATVVGGTKTGEQITLAHTNDYAILPLELPEGTYILNSLVKGTNPPVLISVEIDSAPAGTMILNEDAYAVRSTLLGYLAEGKHSLKYTFLNDARNRDAFIKNIELVRIDSNINLDKKDFNITRLPFKAKSGHIEFGKNYTECPIITIKKNKLTILENAGDENDFAGDGFNINPAVRFSEIKNGNNITYRELINSTLHYISFEPDKFFSNTGAFELENNAIGLKSYLKIRYQDNTNASKKIQWDNTPANDCKWAYADFIPSCTPERKADGKWKTISCEVTGNANIWSNTCNRTSSWANFMLVNMNEDNLDYAELSFEGFDERYFAPKAAYTLEYEEIPHKINYIKSNNYCTGANITIESNASETYNLEWFE